MSFKEIIKEIKEFTVNDEMEDIVISEFFDVISEKLNCLGDLSQIQKEILVKTLFSFLLIQNPEMEQNFSFIHLIEDICDPENDLYSSELFKFNEDQATITSILLLNRYLNSLMKTERKKGIELLKSISINSKYSDYIREEAFLYYQYQAD